MLYLLYFIHILISIFLILVVLLQQGKGADLSVFGGGASQAAFGARGATNILHRMTVIGFVMFIVTTLTIGVLQGRGAGSVMSTVPVTEGEELPDDLTAPAGGELIQDEASGDDATLAPAEEPADDSTDASTDTEPPTDGGDSEGENGS